MLRTWLFLATTALFVCANPQLALAQPGVKTLRIGVLHFSTPDPAMADFMEGMRELGYVEGKNLLIEQRYAESKPDRLRAVANELVKLAPALIVVPGHTPSMQAAKAATKTIPIVFIAAGDPVGSQLVDSLARPGGNATGLTILSAELASKRLELLREIVPALGRIAVVWNPSNPAKVVEWKETEEAAQKLGFKLHSLEVRAASDFDSAFLVAQKQRADALIAFSEPLVNANRQRIADFANARRVPSMYTLRQFVDAGGLVAYGPSLRDMYRRAAFYVDRIARGAKPGELPVEQPAKFELTLNLRTAKALGVTIPQALLLRADHVVQ